MSDAQENNDFDLSQMDSYKVLLSKLKVSLVCENACSSNYFNNVILECKSCIEQCLSLATSCIDSMNCNYLLSCLENGSNLLQMLSDFIRKVLESIPFVCSNMKQYPTATASIILSVFDHCKTSECAYGEYLNKVQIQLKGLFRACHELQLIYLMTLEKHFTFDLSQADDFHVLLETLDLNLKIGEAVQNLDIKTMAEQWKAYTALCDKYCKYIEEEQCLFRQCTDVLCEMIRSNFRVTLEMKADCGDKAIARPVKVASFAIKILTKICNIFKRVTHDSNEIIDLHIFLNTHNGSYMRTFLEKSAKVVDLIEDNIRGPLETLLTTLVANHAFVHNVCRVDENELENEKFIGYIIVVANIMKVLPNHSQVPGEIKLKLITRMFHLLPSGHTWFNVGLKVEVDNKTFGLFAYALTVSSAFARTFTDDEYGALERLLLTALLGAECYGALFAADFWLLSMRSSDSTLVLETTLSLLEVYQSLAEKTAFQQSPRNIYLTYAIRHAFGLCSKRDKSTILNTYKIEEFFDIWSGVELTQMAGHQSVVSLFPPMLRGCLDRDEAENVLAETPASAVEQISASIGALWSELMPCEGAKEWDLERVERLTALTEAFVPLLPEQTVRQILNIIGHILKRGDNDIVFVLFQKYCLFEETTAAQNPLEEEVLERLSNSTDEVRRHVLLTLRRLRGAGRAARRR